MPFLTRRLFCKNGALALSALHMPTLQLPVGTPDKSIRVWVTSDNKKWAGARCDLTPVAAGSTSPTIEIWKEIKRQNVLGFGAAMTDSSCFLLNQMEAPVRHKLLEELWSTKQVGLNVMRVCIGASDYARTVYSYDDSNSPDPELQKFSIDHDRQYILPVLREILSINPNVFVFATPWSPPGWMKTGGSLLGGSMRKRYFAAYARYFVRFLQAYAKEGVPVRALTVQNEVDTDQDGKMPATLWGQEYEIEFVEKYLGPALADCSPRPEIWILDHNYNLKGRVLDELNDPAMKAFVKGVAWHGYGGSPDAMTQVHRSFPDIDAYWTEGGPDITDPMYQLDWAKWANIFIGAMRNWSRCAVAWNLILDERGEPKTGPFSCGGVVTVDSQTGAITRSGQYWALEHFAKCVSRGANVIESKTIQATEDGPAHVAFSNPDGTTVVVIANAGESRKITCRSGAMDINATLDANSLTTIVVG